MIGDVMRYHINIMEVDEPVQFEMQTHFQKKA
jgi:hypothetical protein